MGRKLLHSFDETFFDAIDTEEKAYWLGFIYADGCIINRLDKKRGSNVFQIKLNIKDSKFLEQLKLDMTATHPISVYTNNSGYGIGREYCSFSIISNTLYGQLLHLGVVQNKSLILTFPKSDIVSDSLINHFARGYFDGDGSIYPFKSKGFVYPALSIIGTFEFLTTLLTKIPHDLGKGIYKEKRKPDSNTYILIISGRKRCRIFHDYIYENAKRFLPRKKEIFDALLSVPITQEPHDHSAHCLLSPASHPLG